MEHFILDSVESDLDVRCEAPTTHENDLLDNSLFDADHYACRAGVTGSPSTLLAHYLNDGEPRGLSPSPGFDVHLYTMLNPDVAHVGASPLRHYVSYGRTERRYATRAALSADALAVQDSNLFDVAAYARHRGAPPRAGLSLIEEYLAARDGNAPIGPAFDAFFYQNAYPDVQDYPALPILHYVRIGRAERRLATPDDLHHRITACRSSFHENYYLAQLSPEEHPADPLRHYVLEGSRRGLDPAPDFSSDYYQRRYPDIQAGGLDPFLHYAAWGREEGRVGKPIFDSVSRRGDRAFDLAKPTLMVTSHEASRTGAPFVALNLGGRLADTHNIIFHLGRGGAVAADFVRHSCLVVTCALSALDAEYLLQELRATHRLEAVLLNSVETSEFAHGALHAGLPSVALIHEFAEYTVPLGKMSSVVESADRVVVPAKLIRDSLQGEVLNTRGGPANNVMVRSQGYLPHRPQDAGTTDLSRADLLSFLRVTPGQTKVVLSAGFAQIRKGVDLFVQTAAEFRSLAGHDVRFLWVGAGYHPTEDLGYSVWVADMIRRLDLEETVLFLPNQSSLAAAFAVADVFYLPARLDPFPNVVLEAIQAGKAVVCFDRATGVAEIMRDQPTAPTRASSQDACAVGAAVPFCDVRAAAQALVRLCRPAETKRALSNVAFAERHLRFEGYVDVLLDQLDQARTARQEAMELVSRIEASGTFDAAFHDGVAVRTERYAVRHAIREYVARGQKGLLCSSPRPGFNEAAARGTRHGPALLPGPDGALPAPTHHCVILGRGPVQPFQGRVGLHLHLYYADLAPLFARDLAAAGCGADLVVTTTSDAKRIEVEYAFRAHRGSVCVLVVSNRGRDIGPFLSDAGRHLRAGEYDVVGHLHGKRSLEVGGGLGDRWREYLLTNLLGLGRNAGGVDAVLAPFAADAQLGLLFAEDRHCVGWTKNLSVAQALAARMHPAPVLPAAPIFPLGTMFWARPAALEPLWALKLGPADFPAEPVPYDGTVLHALERMLPAVCEATGHGWCTVFQPGTGW